MDEQRAIAQPSSRLPEDGSVLATHEKLELASQHALTAHETEPCLRAQEMDEGRVSSSVQVTAVGFWSTMFLLSLRQLLKQPELFGVVDLQSIKQILASLANSKLNTLPKELLQTLRSLPQLKSLLRGILGVSLALLSYCPIGRLAFGRPLRRQLVRLTSHLKDFSGATKLVELALQITGSRQATLALLNTLLLPMLISRLRKRAVSSSSWLAGRLASTLASLHGILTVGSGVALYSILRPKHLVPTNPWKKEPSFHLAHPSQSESKRIGVLFCNLGSTKTPQPADVEVFLREFLSDARVVEILPAVWKSVLNAIILPVRRFTSGKLYQRLFETMMEGTGGKSPLLYYTDNLVASVQTCLGKDFHVAAGMRYGQPSIERALEELKMHGCQRILLVTSYPQYSSTTVASIYDEVFDQLKRFRNVPTLHIMPPYYAHAGYISSLARIAQSELAGKTYDKLVISFHGIPERYYLRGDPYPWHCEQTARALADELGLDSSMWVMTYQSVFGKDPWLRPATDETIERLAKQGLKTIAVICPGFLADCLETVDENGHENANIFHENGGEQLHLVSCLNDNAAWAGSLAAMIAEECAPWRETARS